MTPIPVLPVRDQQRIPSTLHGQDASLRVAAEKLEATFISEMLKAAGLDRSIGAFGGGSGEEQFNSFLRAEQAEAMVRAGGIGHAESLFNAMKTRADA